MHLFIRDALCVCVCVCVCEREREREREKALQVGMCPMESFMCNGGDAKI